MLSTRYTVSIAQMKYNVVFKIQSGKLYFTQMRYNLVFKIELNSIKCLMDFDTLIILNDLEQNKYVTSSLF